jgi:hypothetical protein
VHQLWHLIVTVAVPAGYVFNFCGVLVCVSRVLLKYLPASRGDGTYYRFRVALTHTGLVLGKVAAL